MDEIDKILQDNINIEEKYKLKIKEALFLILKKYPICQNTLLNNLKTITIKSKDNSDLELLKIINANSCYITYSDTLILDDKQMENEHYLSLLVHEMLHIASYDKKSKNMGFEDGTSKYGVSLNEGMTELLTRQLLGNLQFGMLDYNIDINNVTLVSSIVNYDEIINCYFNGGLSKLSECFKEKVKENYFSSFIKYMDYDFSKRNRKKEIEKDSHITYLISYIEMYRSFMNAQIGKNNVENELNYVGQVIDGILINDKSSVAQNYYKKVKKSILEKEKTRIQSR